MALRYSLLIAFLLTRFGTGQSITPIPTCTLIPILFYVIPVTDDHRKIIGSGCSVALALATRVSIGLS